MGVQITNNAASTIPLGLASADTSFTVESGDGALFPALGASDFFNVTISNPAGNFEIVRVTARSGDSFTIVRGQEGTVAIPFPANSRVELRVTVANVYAVMETFDFLLL